VTTPEAVDALAERFAETVQRYRADLDEALRVLGEARQQVGYTDEALRLRDVWDDLSPLDRREALKLFWKEVRVGPGRHVSLVARGAGRETEVELPASGEDKRSNARSAIVEVQDE
jgi:hypothetical protein